MVTSILRRFNPLTHSSKYKKKKRKRSREKASRKSKIVSFTKDLIFTSTSVFNLHTVEKVR